MGLIKFSIVMQDTKVSKRSHCGDTSQCKEVKNVVVFFRSLGLKTSFGFSFFKLNVLG